MLNSGPQFFLIPNMRNLIYPRQMGLNQLLAEFINKHVLIAALLGTALGLEREIRGKDPSLRTFCFITMGSCLFAMLSVTVTGMPSADPSRVTAQIVTGVGFLGAGAIFRSPRGISGLTTAAMMWVAAAIGAAVGIDQIQLAVVSTLNVLTFSLVLNIGHQVIRFLKKEPPRPH